MSNKLVGKTKQVFNTSLYYDSVRSVSNPDKLSEQLAVNVLDASYFTAVYSPIITENNQDKLRISVGSNFNLLNGSLQKNSAAPQLFNNQQIQLEHCHPDDIKVLDGLNGMKTQEVVVLKVDVDSDLDDIQRDMLFKNWIAYVKTGIDYNLASYEPIVKCDTEYIDLHYEASNPFTPQESSEKGATVGPVSYTDFETYYNELIDSKEYEDLLHARTDVNNSIPNIYGFVRMAVNKAFKSGDANLLANLIEEIYQYYNGPGVSAIVTRNDVYNNLLKNYPLETLVTLYGTVSRFNVDQTTGEVGLNEEADNKFNNELIQKIINFESKNLNKDALLESYIDIYTRILSIGGETFGPVFDPGPVDSSGLALRHRINALERSCSRLAFSPNFLKLFEKANKYKDNFPYYFKLTFTSELVTEIGDLIKDLLLTRVFSRIMLLRSYTNNDEVMAQQSNPKYPSYAEDRFVYGYTQGDGFSQKTGFNPWDNRLISFYDYYSEKTYVDIASPEIEANENELSLPQTKESADALTLVGAFLTEDFDDHFNVSQYNYATETGPQSFLASNSAISDIRNNMVFVRDDFNEPVELDEDKNAIFQKLAGTILNARIIEKYNQVRRSFKEIMEGVPAYTEDLFYKIVKYKKQSVGGTLTFVPIQYMLFPNTSDVNIVEYVDTQLKYAKTDLEVYKYEVYSQKIVFGSKYKYKWGLNADDLNTGDQTFNSNVTQTLNKLSVETIDNILQVNPVQVSTILEDDNLNAGLGSFLNENLSVFSVKIAAEVEPNIKIIEDKLFTTPDIMIMDVPPVPPEVNIIPYRAVNNRLKILFSGMSDRYRQAPISILSTDNEEFQKILNAQVSPDGLVEFGSDDPVNTFQVFRIDFEPTSYTDFELRQVVDGGVYEEKLLPNKKYWYVFRSVDIRGHFSNPSVVYQVELIDEQGAVRPLIRTFTIKPPEQKQLTRDFKKYLYIKPSILQLYKGANDEVNEIFSSDSKKKKYKIRLTSKTSGKKIDLNLVFKRKQETNS